MKNAYATSTAVKQVLATIDRAKFVELKYPALVAGHGIPSEKVARQLLSLLDVKSTDKVLLIGVGAGYMAALLAKLALKVIAIDQIQALLNIADKHFKRLSITNVELHKGDGNKGLYDKKPFNIIIVSTPSITNKKLLLSQLSDKGRLLAIEYDTNDSQSEIFVQYQKTNNNNFKREELSRVNLSRDSGSALIEMGVLDEATLQKARKKAKQDKKPIIYILRKLMEVEDNTLYKSIAKKRNLLFEPLEKILEKANAQLFGSFSRAFLDSHHLIPVYIKKGILMVATDDPDSDIDSLYHMYPCKQANKILVTPHDYYRLWSTMDLCLQAEAAKIKGQIDTPVEDEDLLEKNNTGFQAHLVALFDALLLDAATENASDIHIEPYKGVVRIRLRIDGELHDLNHYQLSITELRGLTNVIKLRAELNIAEKRLPQGGRSQMHVGGLQIDLRVQVQPALHGEHTVIRLLPQNNKLISINQLGLPALVETQYRRLLNNPVGLVLVVGPTGSGKSTTLYAGLQILAADDTRKVLTVEDPIEYSIENIQQTNIRPDIGFNFSDAMRSFVRQDPDVVLVGEIRDHETALEALRASQTGHLVLSTLHCNDSIDALQRLYDLRVQPNSIASELSAVLAQRLAKSLCQHCAKIAEPDPSIIQEVFPSGVPKNFCCFEGQGCSHCNGRGTKGRIAVVEYIEINADLRNAISKQVPIAELRNIALDSGLISMRDSALDHVIQGRIALSELPRILPAERMRPEQRGNYGQ